MLKQHSLLRTAFVVGILQCSPGLSAAPIDQYATSVLGFSSQWSPGGWSAAQALGAPNTDSYGDIATAWAPLPRNGSLEHISLGYDTPVYASGAVIRETYGNGFVYQIDVIDTNSNLHTVWSDTDPSVAGAPVDFAVAWTPTEFLVSGLKIYTDTDHNLNAWEEIDSVLLRGDDTAPIPIPAGIYLLGSAFLSFGLAGRRRIAQGQSGSIGDRAV